MIYFFPHIDAVEANAADEATAAASAAATDETTVAAGPAAAAIFV